MRQDMAKIIVERPRSGGGASYPRRGAALQRTAPENWPRRESMKRAWRDLKWLNENLAPLVRYLRSNVGRPWNRVFSEISQRICLDSAVQLHIWQHVKQYVCLNVVKTAAGFRDTEGKPIWSQFFVDPSTGLLRYNPEHRNRWTRVRPKLPPQYIRLDASHVYKQIEGLWYEIELRPAPPLAQQNSFVDVVRKVKLSMLGGGELRRMYGCECYAVKKRQLNKKEIRRLQDRE